MGIRNGQEFVESLRDGRTVYVNGERVKDVTTHPPFRGVVATLASLYDLQHQRRDALTYQSPSSGDAVAMGFMASATIEETERRAAAEEIRAAHTHGLMGRMPDFCPDADVGRRGRSTVPRRSSRFGVRRVPTPSSAWHAPTTQA